jgi:ribosomal protein L33
MTYFNVLRLESLEKFTVNLIEVSCSECRFGLRLGVHYVRNFTTYINIRNRREVVIKYMYVLCLYHTKLVFTYLHR